VLGRAGHVCSRRERDEERAGARAGREPPPARGARGPARTEALTLELRSPAGAFGALEDYLAAEGFWAREDAVAELYLGYGLAAPLLRSGVTPPPEPCDLPLLACRIGSRPRHHPAPGASSHRVTMLTRWGEQGRRAPEVRAPAEPLTRSPARREWERRGAARPGGRPVPGRAPGRHPAPCPWRVGTWRRSWTDEGYAAAIERVRAAIARGDVYQVNLVQHLAAGFEGDPAAVAAALRPLRPLVWRPFVGDGWAIVSASPELFLARRGRRLRTAPIKGTRPAGEDVRGAKDAAEHVMIVDLARNDLARVCEPGSVRCTELQAQRELAGVTHLVSTVEGTLREDAGLAAILEATFPGGSVTGAPKLAALDLIAALEPVGRGASMGALGTLHSNGDFELALTIRTFAVADGRIHLWVGGGVVWDSEPEAEIEESWVKARPLLAAVRRGGPA